MPKAENVGDLITADHEAPSEESESRNNHRYAVVVQDLATQWLQSYPCKTKTFQETQKSLMKFLEPTRKPKVIHTENFFGIWQVLRGISWNHCSVLGKDFLHIWQSFDVIFCRICTFQCCMLLQGTLGGNFDIFAASGESTAWVLLWKTRSRPIGVRVCLLAQLNFVSTAFDPRVWTMVVLWKEDSGRQPQLMIPEIEGGDETNCPSPPRFTSFDHPDVLLGPCGPPVPPGPPGPPGLAPG